MSPPDRRSRPPIASRRALVAMAAYALLASACDSTRVRAPVPGLTDDMGRAIGPLAPDHGWAYEVESGALPGALSGSSERLGGGLVLAIRAESGLPGTATTHSIEEWRPAPIPVGAARWPAGVAGCPADLSGDVLVDWMVGLRERGTCSVEVEMVPRLTPTCSAPVLLEALRIRRTLALGDALVLSTDPVARSSELASALVGTPAGRAGRFVVRVRR